MRTLLVSAVAMAAALYVTPLWLDIPLLDPDEGLHAAIAQEMVEKGDWVTPRFGGQPFYDKPVLYFWAQAASLRTFGMTEAAVRLPGLAFTLLGVATTALLGWRLLGREAALLAALFQMSLVLPAALGQFGVHDVALVPWVNLALLCLWEATRPATLRPVAWFAAAGLWLALAILTKGLIGPAFVGLALATYLIVGRRLCLHDIVGGALALAVATAAAAPWYALMLARNPGYARYYFWERHVEGFLTSSQRHGDEPWWYYLPIMLGGALPWIAYAPLAWRQWRLDAQHEEPAHDANLLLWAWLGSGLLFLSLAQSKMATYALPLFPPLALIAAGLWSRMIAGTLDSAVRRWAVRTFVAASACGPLVLPIAMAVAAARFELTFGPALWIAGALIALGSWAPLVAWRWGRTEAALAAGGCYLAAVFGFVMAGVLPQIAPHLSARPLARHLNQRMPNAREVLVVNERVGSLVFYLSPDLRRRLGGGRVHHVSLKELLAPPPLDQNALVALPTRIVDEARRCRRIAAAPLAVVGHYHVCNGRVLAPYLAREPKGADRLARGK